MTSPCSTPDQPAPANGVGRLSSLLQHLHFVQSLEPLQGGGLGRAAFELHEAFLQANYPSLLVTTTEDNAPQLLPATREFPRAGPSKAFFSPALAREADHLVQDADVLHGHGFYVATNWLLAGKGRRYRKALVYHPHGFFEPWILQRSRWKKRVAHWLFEDSNFKAVRLWRALTGKEADQIRLQGFTAPIIVAPNGIRLEPFDNIPASPHSRKRRRVLFLGRLHPKKGIDLLLQAWGKLAQRHPDWEIVVAGPNEDDHLTSLREIVQRLGLGKSVTFPGPVTGTEKVRLIKSADLFALTSRSEGFSVAVLEAMACRVPVLLTTPCNFHELAASGGGFECEPDLDSIHQKFDEALSASDEERRDRGESGRRLVQSRYTWHPIAHTILQACEHYCR